MKTYSKPELMLESLTSDKDIADLANDLLGDSEGEIIEISAGDGNWAGYLN